MGRVARALSVESCGACRPAWTIGDVTSNIDTIRSTDSSGVFSIVPWGHIDHLRYSFAMATADRNNSK
ncbi:hypothetical protein [Povalibacter sp.]|uniref:hypothetical protein n=1 Tax=Povalibacter sp. TaxID=1962978 RepID=UPI002F4076C0